MPQDDRNILDVLKAELNFVQKGGYGSSPREPRNVPLIFEDSPTCANYDTREHPIPCAECALMQFVPPEKQGEEVPCRHIPLRPDGETLFGFELYRDASQQELESTLTAWLRRTIARLEAEQTPKERS